MIAENSNTWDDCILEITGGVISPPPDPQLSKVPDYILKDTEPVDVLDRVKPSFL